MPDVALAGVMAGVLVVGAAVASKPPAVPGLVEVGFALGGALALLACRRAPGWALAAGTVCMLGYSLVAYPSTGGAFPVLIATYAAAWAGHRVLAPFAGAVFVAGSLAINLAYAGGRPLQELVERAFLLVGWFVAACVGGAVSRQRQAYLRQVEQRAADAERTREEVARRRAGEERLRIARELHDSLTHSISIIKVQAGVAVHLARKRREDVPGALLAIQEASGEAMRELRATLDVLRGPDEREAGNGLDRIAELVERARATGLEVSFTVAGPRPAVLDDVGRAAYRIVQEALTNVTRHAAASAVRVRLAYGADELTVCVEDDGRADPGTASLPGVGLIGMRERVGALGGRLLAEPRAEGGFTVLAELPFAAPGSEAGDRAIAQGGGAVIAQGGGAVIEQGGGVETWNAEARFSGSAESAPLEATTPPLEPVASSVEPSKRRGESRIPPVESSPRGADSHARRAEPSTPGAESSGGESPGVESSGGERAGEGHATGVRRA